MTTSTTWSHPTSDDEAARRAAGRTHWNTLRRDRRIARQRKVTGLLVEYGSGRGVQARIARELGVSEATISRDVRDVIWVHQHPCPTCQTVIEDRDWQRIAEERAFSANPDAVVNEIVAEIGAADAIRALLPTILAEYDVFEDDDGDLRHLGPDGFHDRPDGRRVVLEDFVRQIASQGGHGAQRAA